MINPSLSQYKIFMPWVKTCNQLYIILIGDVLKHASDAGDAGDAGYLLKTYNQPCNSLLMSALYETMNSDAGKY